jgi:formamidopyrimidine-DNA glycosylase
MPELPEVETIVRGLAPQIEGRRIDAVWGSRLPLRLARPVALARLRAICVDQRVETVRRRGKYILLGIGVGVGADAGVSVHLGMSGRLRVQPPREARPAHTHIVFTLEGGDELRFIDPRRFGSVTPADRLAALPELALLGPDPLTELDDAGLARRLEGVRAPIKAFLLDQRRVAGLGNIYVSEALHRAGIHPGARAGTLRRRAAILLAGIRGALESGIANRGTTLRDYVDAMGSQGDNQNALLVYGREGLPCLRCRTPIRRRVDSARSTFFCPRCQRR